MLVRFAVGGEGSLTLAEHRLFFPTSPDARKIVVLYLQFGLSTGQKDTALLHRPCWLTPRRRSSACAKIKRH
jgi:hypothetical protein